MTRLEAMIKISKLRTLASQSNNAGEAESARRRVAELMKKHGIGESDLHVLSKAAAMDEILTKVGELARSNELPPAVGEVISRIKKDANEEDKARALDSIVLSVKMASLIVNRKKIGPLRDAISRALETQGLPW